MKLSVKVVLAIILISGFNTALGIYLYQRWIEPQQVAQQYSEARLVAETDLLLSEKFSKAYRSSSPTDFTKAANDSRMSVVFIESEERITNDTYFTRNISKSTGSGVIISNDGYIVTNNHVIAGSERLSVVLNDRREYEAKIVGTDEQTDLALLKIEGTNLPYLIFGNSDSLLIGEWVLAVGNPFRLRSSVTAGIVSAKARNINILEQKGIESFIQTDAAVNPGNSGGALISTDGSLIGINTAILSQGGGYEGFSFAIPANLVKKIVRDLKEFGVVQRGWMGVTINNVNATLAEDLQLPSIKGVYVDATTKDGAARDGGLQHGDVILKIDGISTPSVPEFMEQIAKHSPGDKLVVSYFRDGKSATTEVTLRNQLNTTDFVAVRKDKILTNLGFEIRDLDSMEQTKTGKPGIYVVSVYKSSTIGKSNIEPGYIFTSYNGVEVSDAAGFIEWLSQHQGAVVLQGFYENYPGEFPYTFTVD